ncbi:HamA C-terminal domain-containing protein [Brevibacillus dissolubilis]|uniref:HamA C-terminal domain-containing protein n=1 Tax=Brevibacillus dissolubilis TaxID=1844116 RepID=UPI00159B8824|nr:DUF1837 domain-containing protein [Brevibacillus dissolubilis]
MDWDKLVQIDDKWIDEHLVNQIVLNDTKLKVRGYSIKFSGNLYKFDSLADFAASQIAEFVFGPRKIKELGSVKAYREASKYFGKKDPKTDGKYGELLLFLFVESVLKCPMVATKLITLTNPVDQVKGGDGIFLGNYEYLPGKSNTACLIGESKIMDGFSKCVDDALESLDRFHDHLNSARFSTFEFNVARNNLILEDIDIEYLYNSLKPGTEEFNNNILVHPVFLMYNTKHIGVIEQSAYLKTEAEEMIKEYLEEKGKVFLKSIQEKLKIYSGLRSVCLDFFIIPVNDVTKFRNAVYFQIHGTEP